MGLALTKVAGQNVAGVGRGAGRTIRPRRQARVPGPAETEQLLGLPHRFDGLHNDGPLDTAGEEDIVEIARAEIAVDHTVARGEDSRSVRRSPTRSADGCR